MSMALAYLAVAVVGFLLLGGLTLVSFKAFNVPLFGTMLFPVKLVFLFVLGFCVAFTLNGMLARFTNVDLRDNLETYLDR